MRTTFLALVLGLPALAQSSKSFLVDTVAGAGKLAADGTSASNVHLVAPSGVAFDASGNLYIVGNESARVLRVAPDGTVTNVAGNGYDGFRGDGGPAKDSQLNGAKGITVDQAGNIYICDGRNNRVRRIDPSGIIRTIAGSRAAGFGGDGGPATAAAARLSLPFGVAVDPAGNIYIADTNNHRVRKVTPGGIISTIAGTGTAGFSGDGSPATAAQLRFPYDVAFREGKMYIAITRTSVCVSLMKPG